MFLKISRTVRVFLIGGFQISQHMSSLWFIGCDMLIRRQLPPCIAGVCSRWQLDSSMFFVSGWTWFWTCPKKTPPHLHKYHWFLSKMMGYFWISNTLSFYKSRTLREGRGLYLTSSTFAEILWCTVGTVAPIYQMNGLLKILKLCRIWKNLRSLKLDLKYMIH